MALATITDLVAIGAMPVDMPELNPKYQAAAALLDFATAQVCVYLGADEADIATWTANEQTVVRMVTAEAAARRLTSPASATAQQLADGLGGYVTAFLTDGMRKQLDMIPRGGRGTGTVTLEQGDYSSQTNWDGWPVRNSQFSDQTRWTW